jgi:general secretion pathway protein M
MTLSDLPGMDALAERANALRHAFEQREVREQRILLAGGIALAVTLFYLLVWEPISLARAEAARELADARDVAQRIEDVAAMLPPQGAAQARSGASNRSLLARVDQLVRSSALDKRPERMTPDGDDAVRIWFEETPFEGLLRWLADLEQRKDMRLESADIERDGEGTVSARLQVERDA